MLSIRCRKRIIGNCQPPLGPVALARQVLERRIPLFGICFGNQILGRALGRSTYKLRYGHRGINIPVVEHATGRIAITSQNHGFVVDKDSLPDNVEATHFSLFDGSLAGLRLKDKPVFAVQYHPEASPGPHDSHYLFKRFVGLIEEAKS